MAIVEIKFLPWADKASLSVETPLGTIRAALESATKSGADLGGADLGGADLYGANLGGADLGSANLYGANLYGANLGGANLGGADLYGANLYGANLGGANLRGANLRGANLYGANLRGAKDMPELALAQNAIIPSDGDVTGWKKCHGGVLVKLLVPADAKRSHSTGRKCRAEFVRVLEVVGADVGVSRHDDETTYRVGETVRCDSWCEDRWQECAGGIHFFITRAEAEAY